jgi:xylulokinase
MDLLLGIDMGTGSSKGVLVDAMGSVLASETIAHRIDLPRPGWAEADADAMWWHEVCSIGAALMRQMPAGASLAGMCVSGVGPCLVLCDDDLRPLRPAILYGVDTRASAEIESLTTELGEQEILERAGTLLSSQAVGPKIELVHRGEAHRRVRDRPPHRQPMRPAVCHSRVRLESRMGPTHLRPPAVAPVGVAK